MKVTVVIPTFRRPELLPKSIESVIRQRGPKLGEDYCILVVSDGDPSARETVSPYDDVIRYEELETNRGQSAVLNYALALTDTDYLCVHHDDDIALPDKIDSLSRALDARPSAGIAHGLSQCIDSVGDIDEKQNDRRIQRYRERGKAGNHIRNQRYHSTIDGAATMYRTAMLRDIGGWNEDLKHGEETDVHLRAPMRGWGVAFVDKVIAQYRVHGKSESTRPNKSLVESGRGDLRPEAFANGRNLRGHFRDDIVVNISSIRERSEGLKAAVEALLPQCDKINLYLYGYNEYPKWLDARGQGGLSLFLQTNPENDRGSREKFSWVEDVDGYYLTCDDDILYPPDYVEKLVQGIERYDRKAICGFHGAILTSIPVKNYYADRKVFHFRSDLAEDIPVDVIGNVCGGFHTSALPLSMDDFAGPHTQDDIYLSCLAQKAGVPRICLAHDPAWIRPNPAIDQTNSIHNRYWHGSPEIAATINEAFMEERACAAL